MGAPPRKKKRGPPHGYIILILSAGSPPLFSNNLSLFLLTLLFFLSFFPLIFLQKTPKIGLPKANPCFSFFANPPSLFFSLQEALFIKFPFFLNGFKLFFRWILLLSPTPGTPIFKGGLCSRGLNFYLEHLCTPRPPQEQGPQSLLFFLNPLWGENKGSGELGFSWGPTSRARASITGILFFNFLGPLTRFLPTTFF